MSRRYSRKLSPALSDLALIWDNDNQDWKLAPLSGVEALIEDPSDSVWATDVALLNGWTGAVYYIVRSGVVTVMLLDVSGGSDTTLYTLPAGYRPSDISVPFEMDGNSCSITTDGDIVAPIATVTGRVTLSYPVLS